MPEIRPEHHKVTAVFISSPGTKSPELTEGQKMTNPEFAVKMKALNDVRRKQGIITPCQEAPYAWDSLDLEHTSKGGKLTARRPDAEREIKRLRKALEGCSICPLVNAECKELKDTVAQRGDDGAYDVSTPDTEGVLAGELLDTSITARYAWEYIQTGEWNSHLKLTE